MIINMFRSSILLCLIIIALSTIAFAQSYEEVSLEKSDLLIARIAVTVKTKEKIKKVGTLSQVRQPDHFSTGISFGQGKNRVQLLIKEYKDERSPSAALFDSFNNPQTISVFTPTTELPDMGDEAYLREDKKALHSSMAVRQNHILIFINGSSTKFLMKVARYCLAEINKTQF